MNPTQREVAVPGEKVNSLRRFLETATIKGQIAAALPASMSAERMIRQTLTLVQSNPKLMDCTQISVLAGIIRAAELGLELNGALGHAYLIPRYSKTEKSQVAHFQLGYKGFINLAFRTGKVLSFPLRTVHDLDVFQIRYGTDQGIRHLPKLNGLRGNVTGFYAAVQLVGGGVDFEYMSLPEIIEHRDRYRSSKEGEYSPWDDFFEAMALKTPCRKLAKRLPLSSEFQTAAAEDELTELGQESPPVGLRELRPPRSEELAEQLSQAKGDPSVDEPAGEGSQA
jgi:recombination protein RecT